MENEQRCTSHFCKDCETKLEPKHSKLAGTIIFICMLGIMILFFRSSDKKQEEYMLAPVCGYAIEDGINRVNVTKAYRKTYFDCEQFKQLNQDINDSNSDKEVQQQD